MIDHFEINLLNTKIILPALTQRTPHAVNFHPNDIKLEVVQEFTLLGLVIDTIINWKSHVLKLKSSLFLWCTTATIAVSEGSANSQCDTTRRTNKVGACALNKATSPIFRKHFNKYNRTLCLCTILPVLAISHIAVHSFYTFVNKLINIPNSYHYIIVRLRIHRTLSKLIYAILQIKKTIDFK